jgi:hypothetical protein
LSRSTSRRDARRRGTISVIGMVAVLGLGLFAMSAGTQARGVAGGTSHVKVMTRNLYLGADLSGATQASNFQQLVNEAGGILRQVNQNRFAVRAKGLAAEILGKKPDLVGLQEVALWRDAPCTDNPLNLTASHVYNGNDYLSLLMGQLNKTAINYQVVQVEPEFDFQTWANTDGNESTGTPFGCDIEGRLTMNDVILARAGGEVQTRNAAGGHFNTLLQVKPGGFGLDVTRGWTRTDARVGGGPWFRFVNTHLEAFDNRPQNDTNQGTTVGNGQVRLAQAKELYAKGGPAAGKLPVVLLGDLNSDTKTPLKPGDGLADQALLQAGFRERATTDPLGCCLNGKTLKVGDGNWIGQFDHKVDHVMTNDPHGVALADAAVTGRHPANGFWDSDHAGLFSELNFH